MALIKLPDGAEIRGKLGGRVYARNRYGNYARGKTQNVNPKTTKQVALRALFSQISTSWRALSEIQKTGWSEAALLFPRKNKVGDTVFLTGSALYTGFNTKLRQIGLPLNTTPPTPANFGVLGMTFTEVAWDGTDMEITFTGTLSPLFTIVISGTQPFSTGVVFTSRSKTKFLQAISTLTTSPLSITSAYTATFGNPSTSIQQNIYITIEAVVESTGESLEIAKLLVQFNL